MARSRGAQRRRFCKRHEALVAEHGEERVMSGEISKPKRQAVSVVERESSTAIALVEPNGNGGVDPGSIRPALAQLAADNLSELQRTLLDTALSATTTRWATVTCGSCKARSRVELPTPDAKSRLEALRLLIDQGLGKTPTAPEVLAPALPRTAREVQSMDWHSMNAVFAMQYADELRDVMRIGGPQTLRQKLRRLSDPERQLLREALAET